MASADLAAVEPGRLSRIRLRYPPSVVLAAAVLAVFVLAAVTGGLLAPHSPTAQAPSDRLLGPLSHTAAGLHLVGTDALGRDLLSNIVVATRLTLVIGIVASVIGAAVGTVLGILAGYLGGWADRVIMRLAEAQTAMPMFLVAILLLSLLGPSILNLVAVLPTLVWPSFARITRAETLRLNHMLFVEATRALGASTPTVLGRHLLPNLAPRLAALSVVEIGHVILAEAGLSFLGVGVQPPDLTWGLLISTGRAYLSTAPWLTLFPGLCLGAVVFCLNIVGRHLERRQGAAG